MAAASTQADLRDRAAGKFERAGDMLFTRAGLEQASGEGPARHRAARLAAGALVADLCCGIGGDALALAASHDVVAVDRDEATARVARHNCHVYGTTAQVVCADVRDVRLRSVDVVFVDPARRSGERRRAAGDTEPPLGWCLGLTRLVSAVVVKAAPGVSRDAVPAGWETEFVAVGRDLKEAVLWSPALATARARATVLPASESLEVTDGPPVRVAAPGPWLVDPNPAVTRAGAVDVLARRLDAWKIDPRIAFLSTTRPVRTAFGRTLRVEASLPWHERTLVTALGAHGVGSVDVRRRGLAGDVDAVRRRLRLTGDRHAVLVMTRHLDRPWALLCTPVDDPPLAGGRS